MLAKLPWKKLQQPFDARNSRSYYKALIMKYLVMGGAGFQGRPLVENLLKNGWDVRVFDKLVKGPTFDGEKTGRLEYVYGDFNSVGVLELIVEGVDVIFHLFSTTLPKTSNEDPALDVITNIVPTLHLLECARKAGTRTNPGRFERVDRGRNFL